MLYKSTGILQYAKGQHFYKLVANINQDITDYYFSLVPKYIDIKRQMYPAHISIVRKEVPLILEAWERHAGASIQFSYSNEIWFSEKYMWLNCWSEEMEQLREELGLPNIERFTVPPNGFKKTFHTTIGNFK